MNLFHYSKQIFATTLMLSTSCGVLAVNESNCSYIEFLDDPTSLIRINQVDGQLLYQGVSSFNDWRKKPLWKISPGEYELTGSIIDKEHNNRKELLKHAYTAATPLYFGMNVSAGEYHQIAIVREGDEIVDISVNTKKIQGCPFNDYLDIKEYLPGKNVTNIALTSHEQIALQNIFLDVLASMPEHNNTLASISPPGFSTDLGFTIDKAKKVDSGVEILSVTPFSIASKLGLRSGDKIIKINDELLEGEAERVKKQIISAISSVTKTIEVNLVRNGKVLKIIKDSADLFVPRYKYNTKQQSKVSRVNYIPLTDIVRYQLDSIMAAFASKYAVKFPKADEIVIELPQVIENRLGITGIRNNGDEQKVVTVSLVLPDSAAAQLGIQVGDKIVSLNEKSIQQTLSHESFVQKLVEIDFIRKNERYKVSKVVRVRRLPEITVKIDLSDKSDYLGKMANFRYVARKITNPKDPILSFKDAPNSYRYGSQVLPYSRGEWMATNTQQRQGYIRAQTAGNTQTASSTKSN